MAIVITGTKRDLQTARIVFALFTCIFIFCRFAKASSSQLTIAELYDAGHYDFLIDSLEAHSDAENIVRARACVAVGDRVQALRILKNIQTASLETAAIYYNYGEFATAESTAVSCRADSGIAAEIADYIMAASAPDKTAANLAIWRRLMGSPIRVFRARAALEIAKIHIAAGQHDSALVVLEDVDPYILNDRDLIGYRLALARIYHNLQDYNRAIDQIDVLIGIHHLASHKKGAVDFAIDSLYPRLELEQSWRLGRILERGRFYAQAIIIFESLDVTDSTDLNLAWSYFGERRYGQASEKFEKLIESPEPGIKAESYYGIAVCAYRQGRRLDAVDKLLAFADSFPDHRLAARALFTAGEFYSGSEIERSNDIFKRLASRYPDSPYRKRALFLLGMTYIEQGSTDEAAQIFASYDRNDETADLFDFWRSKISPADSGGLKRIVDRENPSFYHFQAKSLLGKAIPDTAIDYDAFIIDFLDRAENFLKLNGKAPFMGEPLSTAIDSLVRYGLADEAGRELVYLESSSGELEFELEVLRKCRTLKLDWVFFSLLEDLTMRLKQLGFSFSQDTWLRLKFPVLFKQILAFHEDKVDPHLALAVLLRESRFNPAAVSSAGAIGLMQLMPPTAAQMAVVDELPEDLLFDPCFNIRLGCSYLRWLSTRLKKNEIVIAAYNAGPTAAKRWQKIADSDTETYIEAIGYDQSRNYARGVMGDYLWYKYLWPAEFDR